MIISGNFSLPATKKVEKRKEKAGKKLAKAAVDKEAKQEKAPTEDKPTGGKTEVTPKSAPAPAPASSQRDASRSNLGTTMTQPVMPGRQARSHPNQPAEAYKYPQTRPETLPETKPVLLQNPPGTNSCYANAATKKVEKRKEKAGKKLAKAAVDDAALGRGEKEREMEKAAEDDAALGAEKEKARAPPLFKNLGNMCFATTSLHLLLQADSFQDHLEENKKVPGKVGYMCRLVLQAKEDPAGTHLEKIIEECGLRLGEQCDADEFLQLLLEKTRRPEDKLWLRETIQQVI